MFITSVSSPQATGWVITYIGPIIQLFYSYNIQYFFSYLMTTTVAAHIYEVIRPGREVNL